MKEDQEKPPLKLSGTDGNVFAIMARVARTLKNAGQPEKAQEFLARAQDARSYDEVLLLCFEYLEIS